LPGLKSSISSPLAFSTDRPIMTPMNSIIIHRIPLSFPASCPTLCDLYKQEQLGSDKIANDWGDDGTNETIKVNVEPY
jgi:hypothetical protein